jgi:hypothetical protein
MSVIRTRWCEDVAEMSWLFVTTSRNYMKWVKLCVYEVQCSGFEND